jgi:hypothetical protein
MHYVAPLIEEAWEHRRRRCRSLAITALAAGVIAALILAIVSRGAGSTAGTGAPSPSALVVRPSAVLSKSPYMGVSCPVANSIACDRVGLAVWLKRPAVSVTATIAGARLSLDNPDHLVSASAPSGHAFDGYLWPAGIVSRLHVRPDNGNVISASHGGTQVTVTHRMWFGEGDPSAVVRLAIQHRGGQTIITQLRVPLAAGWG